MKFRKLYGDDWWLTTFVDASKGVLPDGHSSTVGYLIWLLNGHILGNRSAANILTCKSGKISRAVSSTYEAETLALTEAMDRTLLLKDQFIKLMAVPEKLIHVEILSDCNDTVESVYSTKQNPKGVENWWKLRKLRKHWIERD